MSRYSYYSRWCRIDELDPSEFEINGDNFRLPVFFHNLKGFDSHIIMTYIDRNFAPSDIQVIPTTSKKYIYFQIGSLRFLDSLQFLNASLDSLVQSLAKDGVDKFQHTERHFPGSDLVFQKGTYCYDIWTVKTNLMRQYYRREINFIAIWRKNVPVKMITYMIKRYGMKFNIQNLRQYHDLYLTLDVLLLADVFENFRRMSLDYYELDPCH